MINGARRRHQLRAEVAGLGVRRLDAAIDDAASRVALESSGWPVDA
jgi:hypothetical protein